MQGTVDVAVLQAGAVKTLSQAIHVLPGRGGAALVVIRDSWTGQEARKEAGDRGGEWR